MARTRAHLLTIEAMANGSFRLFGYFKGEKLRKQSKDFSVLQKIKEDLEANLAQSRQGPVLRATWLSDAQLRDAEAATLAADGRKLTERVTLANSLESPDVEAIEWPVAIARWGAYLEKTLRRYPATLTKNRIRMEAFSRSLPWKFVHETKPDHVERWILREGITPRTQITDGSVVRSFFRFAQKRRWCGPSPMEVDLTELSHQSGPAERPRILTPEQCQALLSAASTHFDGELLPFVLLSTWCFMRKAEVCRTTVEDINIAAARIEISPRKQGTPSYRFVNIPPNAIAILNGCVDRKLLQQKTPIAYNRSRFDKLREIAGLWTLGPRTKKRGRRSVTTSIWQENILRHTGISYLYQENGDVREVCRQAGNSSDTAFKHYLHLPEPGAAKKFFSATV